MRKLSWPGEGRPSLACLMWSRGRNLAGAPVMVLMEGQSVTGEGETSALSAQFFGGIVAKWTSGNGSPSAKNESAMDTYEK